MEDEAGLRGLMLRTLEQHGYTVLTTENVGEALASGEHHAGPVTCC